MVRPVITNANLVGRSGTHLCTAADAEMVGAPIHERVVRPLLELRSAAAAEGFQIALVSGYRGFERQLSIWNRKASGELAVLDTNAAPLDIATLTPTQLMFAILRWSALPGASRHHWGTDVDVYDFAAKPQNYEVELVPAEVDAGGMFAPMHAWLDERIAAGRAFGFFRPYDADRNGIAPERWHLSYAPVAAECAKLFSVELLRETLQGADLMLKQAVLANLDEIYGRFVTNINPAVA